MNATPGAGNAQDSQSQLLIGVAGIAVLVLVAGYFASDAMTYGLLKMAYYHLWVGGQIYSPYAVYAERLAGLTYGDPRIGELGLGSAVGIATEALRPYAVLVAAAIAGFGIRTLWRDPKRRYRRHFTQESLLERNAAVFPAVRPVVGLNLNRAPNEHGPWRVADDYIRFALHHRLTERIVGDDLLGRDGHRVALGGRRCAQRGDWLPVYRVNRSTGKRRATRVTTAKSYPRGAVDARTFRFSRERAHEVFAEQLGEALYEHGSVCVSHWQRWPAPHRALMAAFLLIGFGPGNRVGREAGMALLERFATGFYYPNYRKTGKPPIRLADLDTRGVNQIVAAYLGVRYTKSRDEKPCDFPPPENGQATVAQVRRVFREHGWLNVLLIRLLTVARERGILITSDFIWLRPLDRTLFYTLNNVGRNNIKNATALVEGAGPLAHYMVEETLGAACLTPEVSYAVEGLEQGLISEGWIALPEPQRHARRAGRDGQR